MMRPYRWSITGRSFVRLVRRTALTVTTLAVACILGLLGVLLLWSYPGKPKPYVDKDGNLLPGSISEKIYVVINEVEQGMFIKGKDLSNPVLLYLHGGMPDYFLAERYAADLEDYFTVIWWEQRGAGLSYRADIAPETLTQEQLIADTLAVTDYLRHRFGKDKIYLMGHSGGSFIGIQAAAQAPERYYAYIGVAQMSNQLESERQAHAYMLEQFTANGNSAMVRKLEAAPVTRAEGTPDAYLAVRDEAMHRLGVGTTRDIHSVRDGIFLASLQSRDYTLTEKVRLWRGKAFTGVSVLWQTILVTDLATTVPELDLPVYFFHGSYDYTCSYPLAKAYFQQLKAPLKGFYTFDQSAHSPIFEEVAKVRHIIQTDVLNGTNSLADES